jgi:hypothetical protein
MNPLRRLFAVLIALMFAVPTLAACQIDDSSARWVALCQDRYTGTYLPDYQCDSPAGIYPMAMPYYMDYNRYHETVEVHHHHYYSGERLTGGVTTRPSNKSGSVQIQSASNPSKVTLYKKGKQAGMPVKMNQDAKKVGTVTKAQKKSFSSSFSSSNKKISNKSSFGSSFKSSSSSSYRKK